MSRPRALVTGAGIRIGRATAIELASRGFEVAVHYHRSSGPAEEVVAACRAAGGEAFAVSADLGTSDGVRSLVDAIRDRWDSLHVLVNNASIFEPVPFAEITPDAWDRMLFVNLGAPFALSQGLLPLLAAADASGLGAPEGQGGLVVHLCDIGADRPVSGYAHYSVSKAGLVMLVKAMAVELAPRVRTVGVSPGQVVWPEWYDEELREKLRKRIPMARAGEAEDVARLIRFLATEAHYLNGVVIPVDGGLACRY
jgi:pteridine reductase